MAQLKTEAPVFREDESVDARVQRLAGFAAQLRAELEFILHHLGAGNIQQGWLESAETDPTVPAWAKSETPPRELPTVTEDDNGRFLGVEDGVWAVVDGPTVPGSETRTLTARMVRMNVYDIGPFALELTGQQAPDSRSLTVEQFGVTGRKNFGTYTITAANEQLQGTQAMGGVTMEVDDT